MNIEEIKLLGKEKSESNLEYLIDLYKEDIPVELKREVVSSIGRQENDTMIYNFINENAFKKNYMDVIYQMYRTTLYKSNEDKFQELGDKIRLHYNNEVMNKMYEYKKFKKSKKNEIGESSIKEPLLLKGDSSETLKNIKDGDINLIFTSPPYYNAREYSDYSSYEKYLNDLKKVFVECNRVLEDGRFIIVNVSPIITKRPGREFESIRYPIHFDIHKVLEESGFYFIDEIIWIKPEASVPNRIGGYLQTKTPLAYKPNCITESILVYRKKSNFLLDKNIKRYKNYEKNDNEVDSSNCWYIAPKSSKIHPAVFPEELCKRVLKYYSFKGDVVLDPFAGSGTFGKVAFKMHRIPVMCELNEDYIKYLEEEGIYNDI